MIAPVAAEESSVHLERSRHCEPAGAAIPAASCREPERRSLPGAGPPDPPTGQRRAWTPARRKPVQDYPFSAVVGSDDMALALVLAAVSPEIGGVLVRGEKGTAKTTMVRGLAALLPEVSVIAGCRFSC